MVRLGLQVYDCPAVEVVREFLRDVPERREQQGNHWFGLQHYRHGVGYVHDKKLEWDKLGYLYGFKHVVHHHRQCCLSDDNHNDDNDNNHNDDNDDNDNRPAYDDNDNRPAYDDNDNNHNDDNDNRPAYDDNDNRPAYDDKHFDDCRCGNGGTNYDHHCGAECAPFCS
jgi:hypothetical protein